LKALKLRNERYAKDLAHQLGANTAGTS